MKGHLTWINWYEGGPKVENLVALKTVLHRIGGESSTPLKAGSASRNGIYIVQALGLDLGYRFSWNQYGPYSSELAQDGLLIESGVVIMNDLKEPLRFTNSAESSMTAFQRLTLAPSGTTQACCMELLSSLHYIADCCPGQVRTSDAETGARVC